MRALEQHSMSNGGWERSMRALEQHSVLMEAGGSMRALEQHSVFMEAGRSQCGPWNDTACLWRLGGVHAGPGTTQRVYGG